MSQVIHVKRKSVAAIIRIYIRNNPFLSEALRMRILNYSVLAKILNRELFQGRESVDSIKVALIREAKRLSSSPSGLEAFSSMEVGVYPFLWIKEDPSGREGFLRERFSLHKEVPEEEMPSSIIVLKFKDIREREKTQVLHALLSALSMHNIPLQGLFILSGTLSLILRPQFLPEALAVIKGLKRLGEKFPV